MRGAQNMKWRSDLRAPRLLACGGALGADRSVFVHHVTVAHVARSVGVSWKNRQHRCVLGGQRLL